MALTPNINQVLSGFDPSRPIGKGGMAAIFLYENRLTGETLAVKSLHPHVMTEKDSISRFFHEVQASTRLDHNNIVHVLGFGELHSKPSMVMEYIDGGDLKNLIERLGILPVEVAAYIGQQILKGLDYSHRLGIVHRDIKPSNILLDQSGHVKITDFGISKVADLTRLTQSGEVLGTPAYMSPEQASGEKLDERSDVFSTGVLLFEMLTNVNPFLAENPSVTLLNIIRCNPVPIFELNPTVPFRLENLVDQLLVREPDNRCSSAAEGARILGDIIEEICPDGFGPAELQTFLANPEDYSNKRKISASILFLERGKRLMGSGEQKPEKAVVEFYRSLFLDPGNREAKQFITSITEKFKGGDPSHSSKLLALEEALMADPGNVPILLQLVKRCRADGEFIKAVSYSKRLARLRPQDVYIMGQIDTLLPNDQVTEVGVHSFREETPDRLETVRGMTVDRDRHPPVKRPGPVRNVPISRASRGMDPTLLFLALLAITVIAMAIFAGKQCGSGIEQATVELEEQLPGILNNLTTSDQPERRGHVIAGTGDLTGRPKELMTKAQESYKSGDKQQSADYYRQFIEEFPDHRETDALRLQLARLYQSMGETVFALNAYDDLINKSKKQSLAAYARYNKIKLLLDLDRPEEARWECTYLEPSYRNLASMLEQIAYLRIYANLCEKTGHDREAIRLYDRIITDYENREKTLEARLLKADVLIRQSNMIEAQRELWTVRDQSRSDTLLHRSAVEKLAGLGLEDPGGSN